MDPLLRQHTEEDGIATLRLRVLHARLGQVLTIPINSGHTARTAGLAVLTSLCKIDCGLAGQLGRDN